MISKIYLGIDCGATTSKVCGVDPAGRPVSLKVRQRPTRGEAGGAAIVAGWLEGAEGFLAEEGLSWDAVAGVGLAIPGPYLGYGVLGRQANLPAALEGWRFLDDLTAGVKARSGRTLPVVTANDGQLAGLGEAGHVQAQAPGGVLMLAPGSGLGASYVRADGQLLEGDHGAAVIISHMPAPYERLGLPLFRCGCGRDWGCFEAYTAISGLPQLVETLLPRYPEHPLAALPKITKQDILPLRGWAQGGDALALACFDLQARALGFAVALGGMAYDPTHVVIGGGLMDLEATTAEFRQRYLAGVQRGAAEYAWVPLERLHFHEAALGEQSQAVGAALLARQVDNSAEG